MLRTFSPRGALVLGVVAFGIWLVVSWPLLVGDSTLYLRDVLSNHFPQKAFGAQALAAGEIPAFNPQLGMGMPFRGNPATLAFYPGNVLYLFLPLGIAFNAHYALHWLLAALAMGALARVLGRSAWGVLFAAVTYGLGGYVLSAMSFYNLIAVAAWLPLVLLGAAVPARWGVPLGGLAFGLALLAGEPVTAALGCVPLLGLAIQRQGVRRGFLVAGAIAGLGLLVALPQLVATARLLPFSLRGFRGATAGEMGQYAFHPARLLELVLPLPFGEPAALGARGWWAFRVSNELPFIFSIHAGIAAVWLAARGAFVRGGRLWAGLALGGLFAGIAGGIFGGALASWSLGLFRYPEKFLLWWALGVPLAAAAGLDTWRTKRPRVRAPILAALGLGGLALLSWWGRHATAAFGSDRQIPEAALRIVETQAGVWAIGMAVAGLVLAVVAFAARRRFPAALLAAHLFALCSLLPVVATMDAAILERRPEWVGTVVSTDPVDARNVLNPLTTAPRWERLPYRIDSGERSQLEQLHAASLDVTPGVLHGLRYPFHPDSEGLASPLHTFLLTNLARSGWPARLELLRVTGTRHLVLFQEPASLGLVELAREHRSGVDVYLGRVDGVRPALWWPDGVEVAAHPVAALETLLSRKSVRPGPAVLADALAGGHRPGGRAEDLTESADRLRFTVNGDGGIAVVRRAFHPMWRAGISGQQGRLVIQPVDLLLLGVEVPAGTHEVVVEVNSRPEWIAGAVSIVVLWGSLFRIWRELRRVGWAVAFAGTGTGRTTSARGTG